MGASGRPLSCTGYSMIKQSQMWKWTSLPQLQGIHLRPGVKLSRVQVSRGAEVFYSHHHVVHREPSLSEQETRGALALESGFLGNSTTWQRRPLARSRIRILFSRCSSSAEIFHPAPSSSSSSPSGYNSRKCIYIMRRKHCRVSQKRTRR